MLIRMPNSEDPMKMLLKKQFDLHLNCLSVPFWQATSVQNSRSFIVVSGKMSLDLMDLKRSPDLLNNVKIGQDQLWLIMKHILFYGDCGHFGQVT